MAFPHVSEMLDYEDEYFLEEDKINLLPPLKDENNTEDSMLSSGVNDDDVELIDISSHNVFKYENNLGMTVTSGKITIGKDSANLIGISIGGGAPLCPCLYIVQVFDNTPAAKDGTLQSGDEILGVSGQSVKGKTKVEVARMIQACEGEVTIHYNKLHADPQQGKTLDIVLKKVKHRLVENMSSATADALGLSRAILCNDSLVKKLKELESTETTYKGLVEHTKGMLTATYELMQVYKGFGDVFAEIGVKEPQPRASEAFCRFGEQHRNMEKAGLKLIKSVKPILSNLQTYLHKAIPDTKLTIKKYADVKFEYLSYCLKVKEMDDEEYSYNTLQEPLYRLETGNYEYRLILRCRQEARAKFAKLRSDVLVKIELLDNKHVEHVVTQLKRILNALTEYHSELHQAVIEGPTFPVEIDLSKTAFCYTQEDFSYNDEDEDEDEGEEAGVGDDDELLLGVEATETSSSTQENKKPAEDLLIGNLLD